MTTLADFLLAGVPDLTARLGDRLAEIESEKSGETGKVLAWAIVRKALVGKLPELLHMSVGDVLAGGWNKLYALRQQLNKSAETPGKELCLQLAEHKIQSEHEPYIALVKDGREIGRVPFQVSLELVVQAAVLRIRDAAVREVQTGQIKGKGTLKYYGAILIQKDLQPIDVPGTFEVGAQPVTLGLSV